MEKASFVLDMEVAGSRYEREGKMPVEMCLFHNILQSQTEFKKIKCVIIFKKSHL